MGFTSSNRSIGGNNRANLTEKLQLFKWDTTNNTDKASSFNIERALNENWDKIDDFASEIEIGSGVPTGAIIGFDGNNIPGGFEEIIDDYDFTNNNGYIRYDNGLQIAWKSITETAGGTVWSGTGVYYSDHTMGDWAVPFTNIFNVISNINGAQYWATSYNFGNSSAGIIRAFRPNNGTLQVTLSVIGIGTWK